MRRFWDDASAAPVERGFTVLLDGRPMHLPGGATLVVPGRILAKALAAEWQTAGGAKGGGLSFADTPLTRLAGTAQERIAPDPEPVIDALARYGESDLLCYRAAGPDTLADRQARQWQPWLDWAALALGAKLRTGTGVIHVEQRAESLHALRRAVAAQDAFGLAGLGLMVPALGSLVLGLALVAGRLDAAAAHATAMLDELYQQELWGADAEAVARRERIGEEIALAARFVALAQAR